MEKQKLNHELTYMKSNVDELKKNKMDMQSEIEQLRKKVAQKAV